MKINMKVLRIINVLINEYNQVTCNFVIMELKHNNINKHRFLYIKVSFIVRKL